MSFILAQRVQEITIVEGTGAAVMLGATVGCVPFATALIDGSICRYLIDSGTGQWEGGLGTFSAATGLTRTVVINGSSGVNTPVAFIAGRKQIFIDPVPIVNVMLQTATIATAAGAVDNYALAPVTGHLIDVHFSALTALASSDTNYITFTITNLGQVGAGNTAMLGTDTTKTTGGTAIAINSLRPLVLNGTLGNLATIAGDRLKITTTVTGTLTNTVTIPIYSLNFAGIP